MRPASPERIGGDRAGEAGESGSAAGWRAGIDPFVVARVKQQPLADLAQIAGAFDAVGPLLGRAECGHQDTDQQRDDADHDEKLDEGEGPRRL